MGKRGGLLMVMVVVIMAVLCTVVAGEVLAEDIRTLSSGNGHGAKGKSDSWADWAYDKITGCQKSDKKPGDNPKSLSLII
ncbi:hypothetical protein Q3G72_025576 [Acer saccharum]|nr:hypothetical protein Q3G72_025576 [Acer saccharum]